MAAGAGAVRFNRPRWAGAWPVPFLREHARARGRIPRAAGGECVAMEHPQPTRSAGLERLRAFLPAAGRDYRTMRNHDLGPGRHGHVSRLSPWIRRRLVTEEEVVREVAAMHGASRAEKFVQEVLWRTYWKGWLEQRPAVWADYRRDLGPLRDAAPRGLADAEAGRTGIEPFDAWARELVASGYVHNHARMWFASIWIFTLELPWQLGADFFYRHLLDGDPASNTLSWRWVAGLHTKGKSYLARADNIARYTAGRFGPVTGLARRADALVEDWDYPREPLARVGLPADEDATGLLITGEELAPETAGLGTHRFAAVAGGFPPALAARCRLAEPVVAFAAGAARDALARAAGRWSAPAAWLDRPDYVDAVLEWAGDHRLKRVVTHRPPVGPWRDLGEAAAEALSSAGVSVAWFRRGWDDDFYPAARAGFFGFFKKVAPRLPGHSPG